VLPSVLGQDISDTASFSFGLCRQPLLVELVWSEVAERLMEAPGFVAVVPGEEGGAEPAEISGQVIDVVELIVVGAEGTFDASVALWVVGAIEVVSEAQLGDSLGELAEELGAAVGLDRLYREGEAGDDLIEEEGALLASQSGSEVHDAFAGEAVDSTELEDGLSVRELDILAVHLDESAWLVDTQIVRSSEALQMRLG